MQPVYQTYLQSQLMQQQRQQQMMALQQMVEQQQMRPQAGQVLQRMYQPQPGLPAPPGTPAGGPQAPPPGTSSTPPGPIGMPPPPGAVSAPPAPARPMPAMPPQPIPPFRALPASLSTPAPAPAGEIGAPPAPAPAPQPEAVSQPQGLQLPAVFKAMKDLGIPADKTVAMLEAIAPAMNMQNKSELEFTKAHLNAAKAAEQFYKDQMLISFKDRKTTVDENAEERKSDQGQQRINLLEQKLTDARQKVVLQYGNDQVRQELTPAGMKVAEELTRAGVALPGGWSRNGMARGNAILNEMGKHEPGGAGSGSIVADRSEAKAGGVALNQVTKDLAAIRPYKEMLDKNTSILATLADKAIATNSQWANKTINWLKANAGDNPDIAEYLFQMNTVVTEGARVLNNPRLVGQLTDSARKDMQDVINGNFPLEATKRILARMVSDGANRVAAIEKERETLSKGIGKKGAIPKPAAAGEWKVEVVK